MNTVNINDTGNFEQHPVRREKESVDDFEHLGLDNSPTHGDVDLAASANPVTRDLLGEIDKTAENLVNKIDEIHKPSSLLDSEISSTMDSNLYEMGDTLLSTTDESDDKMDKYLSQLTAFAPPVPSHDVSPIIEDRNNHYADVKNFLEMERDKVFINDPVIAPVKVANNLDFSETSHDLLTNNKLHDELLESLPPKDAEKHFSDDLIHEIVEAPTPKHENVFTEIPAPKKVEPVEQQKVELPQLPKTTPEVTYTAPKHAVEPPPAVTVTNTKVEPITVNQLNTDDDDQDEAVLTDAEVIFKKMGLDAWFHPERLNPRVESLIYWRDPAKSGPVFGGVLVILLALTYLSLISVIAYLSLLALTATISFRIYKNVLHAVQKTGDGHPFKEFLDKDITLPQDKVKEFVETAIAHLNGAGVELRRLFLVDDLVDSIKFGVLLWCLTYLGAWFNGMTLVIIAWVALFTLPKVYETNKTQIDANLDLVRSKIADITSKVKAAIPIGKKEEKKEQ